MGLVAVSKSIWDLMALVFQSLAALAGGSIDSSFKQTNRKGDRLIPETLNSRQIAEDDCIFYGMLTNWKMELVQEISLFITIQIQFN